MFPLRFSVSKPFFSRKWGKIYYKEAKVPTQKTVWVGESRKSPDTWRIIPGLVAVVNPLPNGRTPWLRNGGGPDYVQILG